MAPPSSTKTPSCPPPPAPSQTPPMSPPPSLPSKPPIVSSSPGRAEKLPTPPLSLLLLPKSRSTRTRTRTRTRTHTRTQPSLSLPTPPIPIDGEPSSPKVTCIGQVRIRAKHKSSIAPENKAPPCCFIAAFRTRPRQSVWRRWSFRLRFAQRNNAAPFPKSEAEARSLVPPKNALLLMRCRSAPQNCSSALAERGRAEDDAAKGTEGKGNESCEEEEEEEEVSRCPSSRPLFLKRCNSEPAKKAARLLPPLVMGFD